MNADWVAATVRSRGLALRRVGAGGSHRIAAQPGLAAALALLAGTTYGERLADCTTLVDAERATRATELWQLRVLAGWVPANGTRLVRAVAAGFERDNIVDLARALADGRPVPEPLELGALATAWPRLRRSTSTTELTAALRRSVWGQGGPSQGSRTVPAPATGPGALGSLEDMLTLVWLRRLVDVAPAARPWAAAAAAATVARILLVDGAEPDPRVRALLRPLLGRAWETAGDLDELRSALAAPVRPVLDGVASPSELWRAEGRLRTTVEADGFRLLRGSRPGPDAVLGAMVVLAVDAWRVRAALADAIAGGGVGEVLDVVA